MRNLDGLFNDDSVNNTIKRLAVAESSERMIETVRLKRKMDQWGMDIEMM